MTRRQRHEFQILRVPRTEDDPPIVRVVLELMYNLCQLVHSLPSVISLGIDILGAKVAPLETIHWPEVSNGTVRETDRVEVIAGSVTISDFDAGIGEGDGGGAT